MIKKGEVWKHLKTGGEYEIVEFGVLQVKSDLDMSECVVYRNLEDGRIWIRPLIDFLEVLEDGEVRFIKIK